MSARHQAVPFSSEDYRNPFEHDGERLLLRLQSLTALATEEAALVSATAGRAIRLVPARGVIHREGESAAPATIVSGWACRQRLLSDGRRQILTFLLPGDIVGSTPGGLPAPCAAVALTAVRIADASPLFRAASPASPAQAGLSYGLRAIALLDEVLLRDQITRLGRQTAYERFGHLMLELNYRLELVGLASGGRFSLPLTQETLADALGLSVVHVNRTVQQMRRDGLLELRAGILAIRQIDVLRRMADWEPSGALLQG